MALTLLRDLGAEPMVQSLNCSAHGSRLTDIEMCRAQIWLYFCMPHLFFPQTEKLLLYGGAIHEAGEVKARAKGRAATSDWMELERARGISITSTAMTFDYSGGRGAEGWPQRLGDVAH